MRFYILLDTSGSMQGAKIGALNDAMSNLLAELKHISISCPQVIDIAVLSFGKEIKWMYNHPINVGDFTWRRLSAGGMTPLGKACLELNVALMSDQQLHDDKIYIILLSDGCPTDDYDEGIESLFANPFFIISNKFAIAIGDNADISVLSRFVEVDDHIYIQNRADELLDTLQNIICDINTIDTNAVTEADMDDDEWA